MTKRVVLAYSGGLDTSVAVRWMREHNDGRTGSERVRFLPDELQGIRTYSAHRRGSEADKAWERRRLRRDRHIDRRSGQTAMTVTGGAGISGTLATRSVVNHPPIATLRGG